MDKDRMNRSKKKRTSMKKSDIMKRLIVILLAVSMISAWPLSGNMVFADNPENQSEAQQSEQQVTLPSDQDGGVSWDQDAVTVEEPPESDDASESAAPAEGTGPKGGAGDESGASPDPSADQDREKTSKEKGGSDEDGKKDADDPADRYKDLLSLTELTSLPDTVAKATIWYAGTDTDRVTKERGWALNDYYVNQPDSHYVKMTEDFTLKHQIEFTTTKDIPKGKIEIRVPLSLFSYDADGEKTPVTPSAVGVPEGTAGSPQERNDTFFNYYISRGTGTDGADELVFFNYEKVPEGTASAWQVLYGKVEAAKVEKDAAWSFIPKAGIKKDSKTEELEEGELAPLKGVVDTEPADEQAKEDAAKEEAAGDAEESAKADEAAPDSLSALTDLPEDQVSAISKVMKKSSGKALTASNSDRPWQFDMYYVRQNSLTDVTKTDDFTLKYQIEFDTSQDIEAHDVEIRVPLSTVKYGHRNEPRREIKPVDIGIPEGGYDPETGEYTYTEARRSAFNYYISRGTGEDGSDELVFFNYRKLDAGEKNAWQVRYAGDPSVGEEAFDVMNIEDRFSWKLDPAVSVRLLKEAGSEEPGEGDEPVEPEYETQTLQPGEVTPLTGRVDTTLTLNSVAKRVYSSGASYTPGLYTQKQLLRYAPDAANVTIPGTSDKLLSKFDDYKFVVWQINVKGYATQPYDLHLLEETLSMDAVDGVDYSGFVVGVYRPDDSMKASTGTSLTRTVKESDGPGPVQNDFNGGTYSKQRTLDKTYFVVTAYPADKVDANTTQVVNQLYAEMVPYDMPYDQTTGYGYEGATGNDRYKRGSAFDMWAWADYDWKYSGDIIGIKKELQDPSRERQLNSWTTVHRMTGDTVDQRTASFNVEGTCRSFAYTHKLEKVNGEPFENEIQYDGARVGEYIPGTYVKVTTTDDFVYAYPNDGEKAGQKYKLTKDDYYFNRVSVSISDSGWDIWEDEPGNTVPVSETEGIDRDLHVFAMFADSDDWEEVAVVPWSSSGTVSYNFTSAQIAREPWRVKIEHNAVDYASYSRINTNISIRGDSPAFEEFGDADIVQLENISGIAGERFYNDESHGYFQDTDESNYDAYSEQGLLQDTKDLYGTVLMRDNEMTRLLGEMTHAQARKEGKARNDTKNGRAAVRYSMEAYEGYQVYAQEAVRYLRSNEDVPTPDRKEVVFYDLLPYGVEFDPSGKVSAGRLTTTDGGKGGTIDESKWDKSQVSVTVDTKEDVIQNYNGTGRTLIRFHVTYSGRDSSVYNNGDWFTGFGVSFDAYCLYENYESASERPNIVAYMPGNDDDQDILGRDSEVSLDDGNPVTSDGFARYYRELGPDINGDGVTSSKNVLYAQAQVFSDLALANWAEIKKYVRAADDPFGEYRSSTMVTPGRHYEYKINVTTDAKHKIRDIVIFDRVENAINDRQAEEPGAFEANDWKGTFNGLNVSELKAAMQRAGVTEEPVIYYNARRDAEVPLTDSDTKPEDVLTTANGWIKASNWSAPLSDVKAFAVDLGDEFSMGGVVEEDDPAPVTSVSMYVDMIAPAEMPEDAEWAYNNAGFFSFDEATETTGTVYCNSVKVKLVESRQFILEKKLAEGTPSEVSNESFKFYVKWNDGTKKEAYSYKEYTIWEKNSSGEWVQTGSGATDAEGALMLKKDQRAMFNDLDAGYMEASEKESIRWEVDMQSGTSDGVTTLTATNTYHPLLYVKKNVKGYPLADEKAINLQSFRMRLTDQNGDPVKNKDIYVVSRALTNGAEPVIIEGSEKLYGDLVKVAESEKPQGERTLTTDENGEFDLYPGETVAIPMSKQGEKYTVAELSECYSESTDWICDEPESTGTMSSGGNEVQITNFYRWKLLKISKKIKNARDNDVDGTEFTFKIYEANSDDPDDKGDQITDFKWQLLDKDSDEPDEDAWQEPASDGTITAACAGKVIVVDRFKAGTQLIVEEVMSGEVAENFEAAEDSIYVVEPTYATAGRVDFVNKWKYYDLLVDKGIISAGGPDQGGFYLAVIEVAPKGTDDWTYLKGVEYEYVDQSGKTVYYYEGASPSQPSYEKDETKEYASWTYGMKTGAGVPYSFEYESSTEQPAGFFVLIPNMKVRFKNLDTEGVKWRVRELVMNPYDKPVVPGIDESSTETMTYPDGYTRTIQYSHYIDGELGDGTEARFVNGSEGYIIVRKNWVGDDEKARSYLAQQGSISSYFKVKSDIPLRVIASYNASYSSNGYYDPQTGSYQDGRISLWGDDSYVVLGASEDYQRLYDLSAAVIDITEMDGSGSNAAPLTTKTFQPYYGEFTGTIFNVDLNGESAEREVRPSEDPVVTFENHLSSEVSAVQKRITGKAVPEGKTLVWIVEKYENGKWIPAEGVGYTLDSYTFSYSYYGGQATAPRPVPVEQGKTGSDGLIKITPTSPFYAMGTFESEYGNYVTHESVAYVLFDRKVYVNHFGKSVKEGDYRVREVLSESDEEWGDFSKYTVTPVIDPYYSYYYSSNPTPPMANVMTSTEAGSNTATGFINTTNKAYIRIEKVVDEPSEQMFTFRLERYVHVTSNDELEAGALLNYEVHDSETDELIREGVTTAKGELKLQGGQYAIVEVAPNSRWKITELSSLPYYIEKIRQSNGEEITGTDNAEMSLAGNGEELVKSDVIRPDVYSAVRELQNELGTGSPDTIRNIILGKTSDYPDVVSDDFVVMDTKGLGTIMGYLRDNGDGTQNFYILSDDLMYTPPDSTNMFGGFNGVEGISFDNTSTERTYLMASMFASDQNLKQIDGLDTFDTSNVGQMQSMFYDCMSLESVDLSSFDTSKVVDMSYMFYNCRSLPEIDMSSFDTSNVENMYEMFYRCSSLEEIDVSNFDTGKVVNMGYMFYGCTNLEKIDISSFDSDSLMYVNYMFGSCEKLDEITGIEDLVQKRVNTAQGIFSYCKNLETLDLTGWDVSGMTGSTYYGGLSNMLQQSGVKELDASGWDLGYLNTLSYVFSGAEELEKVDLTGWNIQNVTSVENMFSGCNSLKEVDLTDWNTTRLYNMNYMFQNCSSLEEADLSGWGPANSSTKYAMYMFSGCTNLKKVTLSEAVGAYLNTADHMFYGCTSLEEVDVSAWAHTSLNDTDYMFANCSSLKTIDLSSIGYLSPRDAGHMFENCTSLETIDITGMRPYSSSTWGTGMFNYCPNLTTIYCNYNWPNLSRYRPTMFYGDTSLPGYASGKTSMAYAYPGEGGYFTAH